MIAVTEVPDTNGELGKKKELNVQGSEFRWEEAEEDRARETDRHTDKKTDTPTETKREREREIDR